MVTQSYPHLLTCKLSYTQADSIVEYHEASRSVKGRGTVSVVWRGDHDS